MTVILYLLVFLAGALCDHYFETKFRAWFSTEAAKVKTAL